MTPPSDDIVRQLEEETASFPEQHSEPPLKNNILVQQAHLIKPLDFNRVKKVSEKIVNIPTVNRVFSSSSSNENEPIKKQFSLFSNFKQALLAKINSGLGR